MKNNINYLLPDGFYHVYNRANGSELIFKNEDNYVYFLEQCKKYILPVAEIYCYCLMPNHFHFLIAIKSEEEILKLMKNKSFKNSKILQDSKENKTISNFLSLQFSHWFNSYAQAFNKQNNRRGSLFMAPFKRKRIDSEEYLRKLVRYIHLNPKQAGLVDDIKDWKFSSYKSILSQKSTLLRRTTVIEWFDDLENFIYWNQRASDLEDFF